MHLSHSKLNTFNTCKKLYEHMYVQNKMPQKRETFFVLGSAVHKFIEHYYDTKNVEHALEMARNVYKDVDTSLLSPEEVHSLEVDRAMVEGICEAYPKFYSQDFTQYRSFLCEKQFKFRMGKDKKHTYMGYIDVLVKDAAGDWWLLETKTASAQSLNADYFERVRIDSQVLGYCYGAKAILGKFPVGVVYNVIKKPGIRLRKGESHQQFRKRVYHEYTKFAQEKNYFMRHEILIGESTLKEWYRNTLHIANEMERYHKRNKPIWPMNTAACTGKFSTCNFLRACIDKEYSPLLYKTKT